MYDVCELIAEKVEEKWNELQALKDRHELQRSAMRKQEQDARDAWYEWEQVRLRATDIAQRAQNEADAQRNDGLHLSVTSGVMEAETDEAVTEALY